jgi:hypothetical protein
MRGRGDEGMGISDCGFGNSHLSFGICHLPGPLFPSSAAGCPLSQFQSSTFSTFRAPSPLLFPHLLLLPLLFASTYSTFSSLKLAHKNYLLLTLAIGFRPAIFASVYRLPHIGTRSRAMGCGRGDGARREDSAMRNWNATMAMRGTDVRLSSEVPILAPDF